MCKTSPISQNNSFLFQRQISITSILDDMIIWQPESPILRPGTIPNIPEDWCFQLQTKQSKLETMEEQTTDRLRIKTIKKRFSRIKRNAK